MELIKSKPYLKEIENSTVYDVAQVTPLSKAETLSKRLKNIVLLKREDLQPIFSFENILCRFALRIDHKVKSFIF